MANTAGRTPLQVALHSVLGPRLAAARCLVTAGPIQQVLQALAGVGLPARPLFADFAIARLPLTDEQWALVPKRCPGMGRALPHAMERSPAQARQLVQRLVPADAARLQMFALCLARAQRVCGTPLPVPIVHRLLAMFDA